MVTSQLSMYESGIDQAHRRVVFASRFEAAVDELIPDAACGRLVN